MLSISCYADRGKKDRMCYLKTPFLYSDESQRFDYGPMSLLNMGRKAAYIDIDAHYGDGVQEAFSAAAG